MRELLDLYRGTLPALMTPCDVAGQPNFDALVATGRELVDAGMRALVYCGSMGDWPLLSDAERQQGVRLLVEAGLPVVVGTGAQNTRLAAAHAAHAREVGAHGLMLLPRVLSRGISPAAQENHFATILTAAAGLPSIIYNSPYYGYQTRAELFFRLNQRFPHLVGFKEFGGADSLSYAAEHITSGRDDLALLVGVDTQVAHGIINCGAIGAITGIGNALPQPVLHLVELCHQAAAGGDPNARRRAHELSDALHLLATFDEGPDLVLYYKHLMLLAGHEAYRHQIHPDDQLSDSQRGYLEQQYTLFTTWYAAWNCA